MDDKLASSLADSLQALVTPDAALSFFAAALLSQATLPGGAMPFCVPLVGALFILGKPALPALVGCAVGLLARWLPISLANGWPLVACLITAIVLRPSVSRRPLPVALAASGAMLLPLPFVARRLDLLIMIASGALAAGVMTPVLARAIPAAGGEGRQASTDDKLCLLLAVAALCLGGMWLRVENLCLGVALAALAVQMVAFVSGAGLAIPAGVLLGLLFWVIGEDVGTALLLAVSGLMAGLLRGRTRVLPMLGSALACGLAAYALGGVRGIILHVPSILVGGLLLLTLPARLLDALRGILSPAPVLVAGPNAAATSYLIKATAGAMAAMANALPAAEAQSAKPVELLACRLCTGCEKQTPCWDDGHDETIRLLSAALEGDENTEASAIEHGCLRAAELPAMAALLASAQRRKEREDARRMEARAWALEQLCGQARALVALSERVAGDGEREALARQAICRKLPALRGHPDALTVCAVDGRLHVWLEAEGGAARHADKLATALGGALGTAMEPLPFADVRGALLFAERPRLCVRYARASRPIAGEEISGDSALCERLDAGRQLFAVSDGMGSGAPAHTESRAALSLVLQAFRAGFARPDALRTVNGLLVACRGDEMFSTLDLCVLNLDSGEAAFEKFSACPSYLLRGGKCRRIGGDAPPMGILDAVRSSAPTVRLIEGDVLLMLTDGVTDAFGGEDAPLLRALGALAPIAGEPQALADALIARALSLCGGEAPDDMTVLAAKIEEAG